MLELPDCFKELHKQIDSDLISFLGSERRFISVEDENGFLEIVFRGRLIKKYFRITEENSRDYDGKVRSGKLYLNPEQFENYLLKLKSSVQYPI